MAEERDPVDTVYLDFQKVLDKVPHKYMGCELACHGIVDNVRKFLDKWFCGREQRVAIYGAESKWVSVTSVVPQGSVLGHVLFLICINDIYCAVHN